MTTYVLIYDAPRSGGRRIQQIVEETRQPAINSAYKPGDKRSKASDES
jgi:hypothetical protein